MDNEQLEASPKFSDTSTLHPIHETEYDDEDASTVASGFGNRGFAESVEDIDRQRSMGPSLQPPVANPMASTRSSSHDVSNRSQPTSPESSSSFTPRSRSFSGRDRASSSMRDSVPRFLSFSGEVFNSENDSVEGDAVAIRSLSVC